MYQPSDSPFPYTTKTGAIITDERCTCGALRSQHEHTLAYGHGPRIHHHESGVVAMRDRTGDVAMATANLPVYDCAKFTWSHFVYTTLSLPHDFERLDDQHVIKIERANKRNVGAKGYRYEIRDLSKPPGSSQRILTCTASMARSKREARDHALTELKIYRERRSQFQILDGGAQ